MPARLSASECSRGAAPILPLRASTSVARSSSELGTPLDLAWLQSL
jgi:hypothetical protein